MITVVGCDPGGGGAFYELNYAAPVGWVAGTYLQMPMIGTGKRIEKVNVRAVADWLSALKTKPTLLALEDVGYMPSGRTFGGGGGGFSSAILTARVNQLIGMLDTLGTVPYEMVQPRRWQSVLGIKLATVKGEKHADRRKRVKAAVQDYVRRRYPTARLIPDRCRVPDDGLVDALAIADYAARQACQLIPGAAV